MLGFGLEQAEVMFETDIQLSKEEPQEINLDASLELPDWKKGKKCEEGWELIDEVEVDYELESAREHFGRLLLVFPEIPNVTSEMDNDIVRIRYKYDGGLQRCSREFCKKMVRANTECGGKKISKPQAV